ncbi:hypothetical protein ACFC25_10780 [Pseudarthrobacter sp. NPDC055928]|uniref:hypothetical protein n=1 Tax=Pseudarthrobacter sp. NPDC055928 TaxID=3345661 RepID=UPI0035D870D5
MVEVADKDVARAGVTSYENWNAALAAAFFSPDKAGELVYLDKDDDAFARACLDVGVALDEADESLARAVRSKICWRESGKPFFADFDGMTRSWVKARRKALAAAAEVPPPPHIALLVLFSSAAERMGGANIETGAAESSYYASLEGLLGIPRHESGRFRLSFTKSSEAFWESLTLWLEDQDGQRGLPSAYALMHRYVGLPISQALVRERERRNLKKMFEEQGFNPGSVVSHIDMHGAIDVWIASARTSANAALRKMWAFNELQNRIVEIALAELAAWDGVGNGQNNLQQKNQRALLTVRDARVMLRSEMRFGLLAGSNVSPGDICRIEGLNAEAREFPLDLIGAGSAGFDFRAVGVDVGSAISGDLQIHLHSGLKLGRVPKKVVILTRDAFSAAYVESDRINAAVLSRLLVRDEPQLLAAVLKILADAAQPGFARVPGGTDGVPLGWTVFKDVMLLRTPDSALVTGTDLSAFEPRLSTQMTISGGLKLPGRMQRWSTLSPIQVIVASETDEPVDLFILTRNAETLQTEESVVRSKLSVPAVVNLEAIPGGTEDFTLSLRRGKTTLQTMAVKRRSSSVPSPDSAQRFRSLCHDLEDPLWPIQSIPNEDAATPGIDGVAVSAPEVSYSHRKVATRPDWNRQGRVNPKTPPLLVAGPPADSCIVTGRHRWNFPLFDGKWPKSRWMYGVCARCGMSKRHPTRIPKSQAGRDQAVRSIRKALPALGPATAPWSALIDALFYLGAGSRHEFSTLARQLEDSAIFENQLLHGLEALGIIELERNAALEVINWEAAATCMGELSDGTWLLTGYWPRQLDKDVVEALEDLGATVTINAPHHQSQRRVADLSAHDVAEVAKEFDFDLVPHAARSLSLALPTLSSVAAGLSRRDMPFASGYEYFDPRSATWMEIETSRLPGLYRVSSSFSSNYYYRNAEDVIAGVAAIVTVQLGKHLAALEAKRPLIAYDPVEGTISVPIGAELPGMFSRAAVMGAGDLPVMRRSDRSVNYFNVPAAAANAIIGKLTS